MGSSLSIFLAIDQANLPQPFRMNSKDLNTGCNKGALRSALNADMTDGKVGVGGGGVGEVGRVLAMQNPTSCWGKWKKRLHLNGMRRLLLVS